MKKRTYEARIHEVEHATFTLLVFSATGGMADEACALYKRLASLLCRGVARLSVMPRQAYLSIVTKYNLWEGYTCILLKKKEDFCAWHG